MKCLENNSYNKSETHVSYWLMRISRQQPFMSARVLNLNISVLQLQNNNVFFLKEIEVKQ